MWQRPKQAKWSLVSVSAKCRQELLSKQKGPFGLSQQNAGMDLQVEWFFRFVSANCRHRTTRKQNGPLCFSRHSADKGLSASRTVVLVVCKGTMQAYGRHSAWFFRFISAKYRHRSTRKQNGTTIVQKREPSRIVLAVCLDTKQPERSFRFVSAKCRHRSITK